MIAIVEYGVGNLFSLESSFRAIGEDTVVTSDPILLKSAEQVVLPGVGAFGDAAALLKKSGMDRLIQEIAGSGKPLLGICLGMQLLFERSYEYGIHEGLGLIPGEIRPISELISPDLKVPHMGWNALHFQSLHPLFEDVDEGEHAYFVHSYAAFTNAKYVIATVEYGIEITAAVSNRNVVGCQFHPEKSGEVGLSILRAFSHMGRK